jgi:CubicO group peptidase (beta-lactamase class C family)
MKTVKLLVAIVCVACFALAPSSRAAEWERWATPEDAGFTSAGFAEAERIWNAIPDSTVSSFFLVYKGRVLASFGSEDYPYWCHSMRKSFLSALYGVHVENGNIDLDATMEELGIDDSPPLTAEERQARVIHLLKARSGVYHEAACESQSMKDARPERGSHAPDTFWYYNNWDFNALGTIFRQETGRDIFEEFGRRFAGPLGMQDFDASICQYTFQEWYSEHPCYTFRMSVRDRARFGQLFLQRGRWNERQLVSAAWHQASITPYSWAGVPGMGYSYMWWTYSPAFFPLVFGDSRLHHLWGYSANGFGGQLIMVLPDADMVAVFGVDVPNGGDIGMLESSPVVEAIMASGPIVDLSLSKLKVKGNATAGRDLALSAKVRNRRGPRSHATRIDLYLLTESEAPVQPLWLGSTPVGELAPGKRNRQALRVMIPDWLAPGRYTLAAVVDGTHANFDLRRQNNVVFRRKPLEIR